ncbi:MAG: hypothetical protein ACK47M_24460, partial [Caldilinea sp.]
MFKQIFHYVFIPRLLFGGLAFLLLLSSSMGQAIPAYADEHGAASTPRREAGVARASALPLLPITA